MNNHNTTAPFSRRFIIAAIGLAIVVAFGAASLARDGAGAAGSDLVDHGAHLLPEVSIKPDRAIELARQEAAGPVDDVHLEEAGEDIFYEIDIGDEHVYVDASNGEILFLEFDNDEDVVARPKTERDE